MATQDEFGSRIASMSKEEIVRNCAREIRKVRQEIRDKDALIAELSHREEVNRAAATEVIRQAREEAQQLIDRANAVIADARNKADKQAAETKRQTAAQIDEATAEAKRRIADANDKADEIINGKLEQARKDISGLEERRDKAKGDVTNLLDGSLDEVSKLAASLTKILSEIDEAKGRIAKAKEDVENEQFDRTFPLSPTTPTVGNVPGTGQKATSATGYATATQPGMYSMADIDGTGVSQGGLGNAGVYSQQDMDLLSGILGMDDGGKGTVAPTPTNPMASASYDMGTGTAYAPAQVQPQPQAPTMPTIPQQQPVQTRQPILQVPMQQPVGYDAYGQPAYGQPMAYQPQQQVGAPAQPYDDGYGQQPRSMADYGFDDDDDNFDPDQAESFSDTFTGGIPLTDADIDAYQPSGSAPQQAAQSVSMDDDFSPDDGYDGTGQQATKAQSTPPQPSPIKVPRKHQKKNVGWFS